MQGREEGRQRGHGELLEAKVKGKNDYGWTDGIKREKKMGK